MNRDYEPDEWYYLCREFQDPGGRSALRAANRTNPRNLPCPDCGAKNALTPRDRQLGYCCDRCANRREMGLDY